MIFLGTGKLQYQTIATDGHRAGRPRRLARPAARIDTNIRQDGYLP